MKKFLVFILLTIILQTARAQTWQYEVSLEAINIPDLGGIQSFAFGTAGGEWLIIGGRLDGLHQRQPFASFNTAGNNNQVIVVNPELGKVWKQNIDFLPPKLKEQLASTNMQFYQDTNMLILTGGYAFSQSYNDHITFPYLTTFDVSEVIAKVKNRTLTAGDFHQIEDPYFAVTGGRLNKIGETYYLVGGHKFMGRYNPMGPNSGPGFIQEYTDAVKKFKLDFVPELSVNFQSSNIDRTNLHRRDYNLVPQIYNDNRMLMTYAGVFQKNENLPWLYPVAVYQDTVEAITSFQQKFNHYHCATLPIYQSESQEMHTLFFGGIAQFYEEEGLLVQDNDVPFVNTIADVAILSDGSMREIKNETVMPGYLGAGSEFIFAADVALYDEGILHGDLYKDEQTVGYIYGGIQSSLPNIFFINTGNESEASSTIYKVKLKKVDLSSSVDVKSYTGLDLQVYPNPAQNFVRVLITLPQLTSVKVSIYGLEGRQVHSQEFSKTEMKIGLNYLIIQKANIGFGAFYYKFEIGNETITRKVIFSQ